MKVWKIILIIVVVAIIIAAIAIYFKKKNENTINSAINEKFVVKCVPDCAEDEICIKGACVKKKISYYN